MALRFTNVSNETQNNGVKMLVYSPAGIGKTVLNATLPNPVLISAESGLLSLRKENLERIYGPNNPQICYNVPVLAITTTEDLIDAYRWATTSHEATNFQSISLDSISEIAEVILTNAKRQVKDTRQAYGAILDQVIDLTRKFRDINNKNIYFSAKMEGIKDEISGGIKFGPSMPGSKLGNKLPYYFDEVYRLGVGKDDSGKSFRFLQTQPDFQYDAKDRSGALAPVEYPHLSYIINKILGVNNG